MLSYQDARRRVVEVAEASAREFQSKRSLERVKIAAEPAHALGRVLAEDVVADREYPPFARSIRDGYAVRGGDVGRVGGELRVVGGRGGGGRGGGGGRRRGRGGGR